MLLACLGIFGPALNKDFVTLFAGIFTVQSRVEVTPEVVYVNLDVS